MQNTCQDLPEISERMKFVLQEVEKYKLPEPEKTFFSIIENRIGDLEIPTTKLLQFFMDPKGEHDLGSLFLRAFFACLLEKDCGDIACDDAKVEDNRTDDGKLPDLVISAPGWVLTIENKIKAPLYNELDLYAKHADSRFPKKKPFFAILSPDGKKDNKSPDWKAVTYKNYCNALKHDLAKTMLERPISKWQVFAREFIVHLENTPFTLCNPTITMKTLQIEFVEKNLSEARELRRLTDCYRANLARELSERMQKEVSTDRQFVFSDERDPHWGFECNDVFGEAHFGFLFQIAFHRKLAHDSHFVINAWISNLTEAQQKQVTELFSRCCREGHDWWADRNGQFFDKREDAISALCEMAKKVFDFFGNVHPAVSA